MIGSTTPLDRAHRPTEGPRAARVASQRSRRRSCPFATIAAVALAILGTAPTAAPAGDYAIDFCKGWSNDAPAAQLPVTSSYPGGVRNDCDRGGAQGGLHAMVAGGSMQWHSNAEIALKVPPDRAGITIKRVWTQYSSPGTGGSIAFVRLWARDALLDDNVTPQLRTDDRLLPEGARDLVWSIYCSYSAGPTPCHFPAPGDVHHVYKARLFLSESGDPELTATGGSLLSGGPISGPQTLVVDAADADSGLAAITVKLDGTVVADVAYTCAFDDWSACRRQRAGQVVDIDTTRVSDGQRTLTVTASDAAGNETRRVLGAVTVANSPIGATAPTKRETAEIRLRRARLTVRSGQRVIIRGRIVDAASRPIARAAIRIDERSYVPRTGLIGPTWSRLGSVVSDASGAFAARIPPGASRALRFSYEHSGVAAAAEARVSVRAGVRVRASRRVVRNGSAVRFAGRVAGAVPRGGVIVTLQAYVRGRGWVPADSRPKVGRASSDGRFGVSYRFRSTVRRTRYLFRILVNEDSAFPYTRAASRAVAVTVLPST